MGAGASAGGSQRPHRARVARVRAEECWRSGRGQAFLAGMKCAASLGDAGGPDRAGATAPLTDPCASIDDLTIVRAEGHFGSFVGAASDLVVHGTYRRTGTWAPDLHALLVDDLLARGGSFLDVGANIGLVAIPVTEVCPIRTFAFEPDPRTAELLVRNVALHGLEQRLAVHACALWSEDDRLTLHRHSENHGDHRIMRESAARGAQAMGVRVEARRLDALVDPGRLARPIVAKLDTQGAEVDVLLGAGSVLREIDGLVCEIWPAGLARLGRTLTELVELLAREFAWAKLLLPGEPVWPLRPLREELGRLDAVPTLDDAGTFFDALLARSPRRDRA